MRALIFTSVLAALGFFLITIVVVYGIAYTEGAKAAEGACPRLEDTNFYLYLASYKKQ